MDLEARKISFVQEFLKLQNEDIILSLEQLLKKRKAESIEKNLKPMSLKSFNERIDKSMEDSKNGNFIEDKDLKSIIDKWN
jgi:predicted HicB family RNase H-like nuclease